MKQIIPNKSPKTVSHLVIQLDTFVPKSLTQNVSNSISEWAICERDASRYGSLTHISPTLDVISFTLMMACDIEVLLRNCSLC